MKKQIYSVIAVSGIIILMSSIFISCEKEDTITNANVETNQVKSITEASAICGGTITNNGNDTILVSGVCWSTSENPTTADKKTTYGSTSGSYSNTLIGLSSVTTYYVRAYATNSIGTGYGNQLTFTTSEPSGTVTDIDGNVYNTITIGTQVWMIENLKTTKYNDGKSIPNITDGTTWKYLTTPGYCSYNNEAGNMNDFGALYNWYTINTGKLAPTGWHVPFDFEWDILENYLIANGYNYDGTITINKIGKSLAATTGWFPSTNTNAIGGDLSKNNSSGFSGLPSGCRWSDGTFDRIGNYGYWWNSTDNYNDLAWGRYLYFDYSYVIRDNYSKKCGFSIRCVRDLQFDANK